MKKFLVIFCVILFVLGVAGAASAISYTALYDAGHYYMNPRGSNSSVSWTFDSRWDWLERAVLDVGANRFRWEVGSGDIRFTIASLITLSKYGTVGPTLRSRRGNFYFNTDRLYSDGTAPNTNPDPIPNPEPATLFLYGTGLIGVAFIARKKFGEK